MPSSEATITEDQVIIKSWNPKEGKYNEFGAPYDQILENLKSTKINFLYKNLAGGPIEVTKAPDDEGSSEEEKEFQRRESERIRIEELARKPVQYPNISASVNPPEPQAIGADQIKIDMKSQVTKSDKQSNQTEPATSKGFGNQEEEGLVRGSMAKGPKKKLTQLPKHIAEDEEDEASFDFEAD